MRNLIRNIMIFLLFILTAFQISTLWFEDFSLSDYISIAGERESSTVDTMDFILKRIIVNYGDNNISGQTESLYDSEYKKIFDDAVTECINKGSKRDLGDFDWKNILSKRAIIYEYGTVLDGSNLPYLFGSTVKNDKTNDITSFDSIIISITPDNSNITTVFYNSENNKYTAKEVQNSDNAASIYEKSTAFADSENSVYISSVISGFDIFSGNIFTRTA